MALLNLPLPLDSSSSSSSSSSSFEAFPFRSPMVGFPVLKPCFNAASNLSSVVSVTSSSDPVRPQVPRVGKPQSGTKHHVAHRRTRALMKWNKWTQLGELRAPGFLQVSANSKADDPVPSEMSLENALKLLGVAEGASFEEILRAKNAMIERHSGDQEIAIQVEAAYDRLLMQSFLQRRAGKVVDNSIRYADVKKTKTSSSSIGGQQWIRDTLSKSPVVVESPVPGVIGTQSAVYAGLMVWTFASGVPSQSSLNANADVPGLILALGFGASIYFLRKQNVNLGKSAALTIAGLVVGAVFGGAVESWLRVDLIPVLGISSPAVLVSEFVLVSLCVTSLYLR